MTHKYLMHIKRSRVFYHIYKTTSCNVSILLLSMNFLLMFTMFKNSENAPDTNSPNEQHKNGCISTMTMNQSTGPISLKRGMIEIYDLTSNSTARVTPILTGRLDCSRIFRFYALHRTHLQVSTIRLNKKYSRYDGTEDIQRVLSPSKSSKYMFKNCELHQRTGQGR